VGVKKLRGGAIENRVPKTETETSKAGGETRAAAHKEGPEGFHRTALLAAASLCSVGGDVSFGGSEVLSGVGGGVGLARLNDGQGVLVRAAANLLRVRIPSTGRGVHGVVRVGNLKQAEIVQVAGVGVGVGDGRGGGNGGSGGGGGGGGGGDRGNLFYLSLY
jgi:hypothetical protein